MKGKTNAMRMLESAKIPYELLEYTVDENDLSGTHVADMLGLSYPSVFKTLVAKGDRTGHVVLCIPVDRELDLKKVAKVTGNKRIEMVAVKDLLPLTGYIRGGCSPIGMKKKFPTYFDATAKEHARLTLSAGVRGAQLSLDSEKLLSFVGAVCEDLVF